MTCVAYLLLRKIFFITTNMLLKPKFCLPCMDLLGKKSQYSSCEAVKDQVFTGAGFFFFFPPEE